MRRERIGKARRPRWIALLGFTLLAVSFMLLRATAGSDVPYAIHPGRFASLRAGIDAAHPIHYKIATPRTDYNHHRRSYWLMANARHPDFASTEAAAAEPSD